VLFRFTYILLLLIGVFDFPQSQLVDGQNLTVPKNPYTALNKRKDVYG
jgi:hypothetical protein